MNKENVFLAEAIKLAERARGRTSPNPLVGAVIVKGGRVIARGYHKQAGFPHAEIEAIRRSTSSPKGATLYVNLEPCFHWGKTPPCVDAIINAGVKKVVIATKDPNPKVSGKSVRKLRRAGIRVVTGVMEREAEKLNEVFFLNMKKKRPFVAAKCAQSLDGKIATRTGKSKWITSKEARTYARSLRDKYDAVLVGISTVIEDDPALDGIRKIPYKVVIDPKLRLPLQSRLVKRSPEELIVFHSADAGKNKKTQLEKKGVRLFVFKDLKNILKTLYKLEVMSVFVEGGAETLGRFFDKKLVDKIHFFYAFKVIGGRDALASIGAQGVSSLQKAVFIKDVEIERVTKGFLVTGYPDFKK